MLYELLFPLRTAFSPFRVFQYISFRAAGAAVTALLVAFVVGPRIIRWLQSMQVHQVVREGTPDTHAGKGTTPTMGGIIILAAILLPTILWMRLNNTYVWIALLTTVWMGAIGFLDDYLKLRQKRAGLKNEGLVERWKLAGQVTLGLALGIYLWKVPLNTLPGASTTVPFFKNVGYPLGVIGFMVLTYFVIVGTSNAVNLTDGLDGLAAGSSTFCFGVLSIIGYWQFRHSFSQNLYNLPAALDLALVAVALVGGCLGFLWWNAAPARIIMGDTGSLSIGASLAALCALMNLDLLLVIIGGLFVVETVSVMLQVFSFRLFGRRIFKIAPIHHHFEMLGWPETTILIRFWILAGLLAALGLGLFYGDFVKIAQVIQ